MDEKRRYQQIFEANKKWVEDNKSRNPDFFEFLSDKQQPEFLYIGCSDSRVHANEIMGLDVGQVFVHRNIANMVINTDLNALSVIDYGVEYLHVKYIVVCGHYGCGGIKAALEHLDYGILNPWLRCIRDVYRLHQNELDAFVDEEERNKRFVELNTYEQCLNVIKTAEVQKSFYTTGFPRVVGWIYDVKDGLLHDLNIDFEAELAKIRKIYDLTQKK